MSHRMGEWRDGAVTLQKITKLLRTQTLNYTFNLELCELSFCSDGQITCYKSAAPPSALAPPLAPTEYLHTKYTSIF